MAPAPPFGELSVRACSEPPAPTAVQQRKLLSSLPPFRRPPASIHSMPSEILALILWFVYDKHNPRRAGLLWVASISHVCRRWRRIALENPRIWSCIRFDMGPRWTAEMMRRARAAPVDMFRHCGQTMVDFRREEIEYIPEHISHIQHLSLSSTFEAVTTLLNRLTQPAPILRSLSLGCDDLYSFGPPITLPPTLFADEAPLLRHLYLQKCHVPWTLSFFSNSLVSLEIEDCPNPPSLNLLLDMLQNSPALETLHLLDSLPHIPTTEVLPVSRTVSLLALSSISLTGRDVDCVSLMQSLHYPASTSLALSCTTGMSVVALLPRVVAQLNGATDLNLRKVTLRVLMTWLFFTLEGTVDGKEFKLEFHDMSIPTNSMQDLIEILCLELPTENVQKLIIRHCPLAPAHWMRMFGPMQLVHTLEVDDKSLQNFPAALLTHVLPRGDPAGFPVPIFPCLNTLRIKSCSLDPEDDVDNSEGSGTGAAGASAEPTTLARLQSTLVNRMALGRPIRCLKITDVTVSKASVATLQSMVERVEWDWKERGRARGR